MSLRETMIADVTDVFLADRVGEEEHEETVTYYAKGEAPAEIIAIIDPLETVTVGFADDFSRERKRQAIGWFKSTDVPDVRVGDRVATSTDVWTVEGSTENILGMRQLQLTSIQKVEKRARDSIEG